MMKSTHPERVKGKYYTYPEMVRGNTISVWKGNGALPPMPVMNIQSYDLIRAVMKLLRPI